MFKRFFVVYYILRLYITCILLLYFVYGSNGFACENVVICVGVVMWMWYNWNSLWNSESLLSNIECLSEKVLENKKYKQKSVENLRFSTLFYLAGVQGLEPWARGFGDRCSTNWATPLSVNCLIILLHNRLYVNSFLWIYFKYFKNNHIMSICNSEIISKHRYSGRFRVGRFELSSLQKFLFLF